MKSIHFVSLSIMLLLFVFAIAPEVSYAADPIPGISVDIGNAEGTEGVSNTITLILIITILSIAPAIIIMMTSFTRIVIVLGFVRTALGTQQMPPNQVLIGIALFLTLFIMSPT